MHKIGSLASIVAFSLVFRALPTYAQHLECVKHISADSGRAVDSRPLTNHERALRVGAVKDLEDFVRTSMPRNLRQATLVGSGNITRTLPTGETVTKPMPREMILYPSAGTDPYASFGFRLETVIERAANGMITMPIPLLIFGREQRINGVRSELPSMLPGYGGPDYAIEIQNAMRESVIITPRGDDRLEIVVNVSRFFVSRTFDAIA